MAAQIEALTTLATTGGSGLEQAFAATHPSELLAAIDQVGNNVGNCFTKV
jgi:hypothetical protein